MRPQARNAAEQAAMMRRVERHNRARPAAERVRTSVEVEKPREELLPLMGLGHVVRGGATGWGGARAEGAGIRAAGGAIDWGRGQGPGQRVGGVSWGSRCGTVGARGDAAGGCMGGVVCADGV